MLLMLTDLAAITKGRKQTFISSILSEYPNDCEIVINCDNNIARALESSQTQRTSKAKFLPCYQKIYRGSEKLCALPHTE